MALVSTADLHALHNTSNQISSCIKNSTTLSKYGPKLWETPRYLQASSTDLEPEIPSIQIFEGLDTQERTDHLPSIATCAVHLEFLAALHELHRRVFESEDLDKVFGIKVVKETVVRQGVTVELKDKTLSQKRQVKWETFVEMAVVRFEAWWNLGGPGILVNHAGQNDSLHCSEVFLPPLDVLMVWHSYLLNPRWFRRDGKVRKNPIPYQHDFPWLAIHQSLNPADWTFYLSKASTTAFKTATSLEPDLFQNLLEWQCYPVDVVKDLVQSMQCSLSVSEADNLCKKVRTPEQQLLKCVASSTRSYGESLRDAVLRQVSFVDKMWDKLWIRSPALESTIRRARSRYNNFLRLFKLYPTTMFVPTLDIDLVWHTHQCSPSQYYTATQDLAGKFVNHDDSIVQQKLDTSLQDTKNLYRMRFGQEYHICGCWDCEALQAVIEKSGKEVDWKAIAKQVGENVAYYRAVEVARRKKEPIPIR